MIIPKFVNGAKIALLAPITIETSFRSIFLHSSYFSPLDNLLCKIAISFPKRFLNKFTICGVKLISGTSTIASFPSFKTSLIICMYTSVLPEPVTPCNKNGLYSFKLFFTSLNAYDCSSFNVILHSSIFDSSSIRYTSFCISSKTLCSRSVFTALTDTFVASLFKTYSLSSNNFSIFLAAIVLPS